jgi:hypothetical protein
MDSDMPWKKRVIESAACFLICTSGMWAWNIYNTFFLPTDFSFYKHEFFAYSLSNLKLTLSTFGKMLIPMNDIIGMFIGILFFLGFLFHWLVKKRDDRNIQFFGIVVILYSLGFLIMPGHLDVFEMDRYFSVITPMVYLLVLSIIDGQIQLSSHAKRVSVYVIVCAWLCYPVVRTLTNIQSWHERSCAADNASK